VTTDEWDILKWDEKKFKGNENWIEHAINRRIGMDSPVKPPEWIVMKLDTITSP